MFSLDGCGTQGINAVVDDGTGVTLGSRVLHRYPRLAGSPTTSHKSDKDSLQSIDYEMLGFRKGEGSERCMMLVQTQILGSSLGLCCSFQVVKVWPLDSLIEQCFDNQTRLCVLLLTNHDTTTTKFEMQLTARVQRTCLQAGGA